MPTPGHQVRSRDVRSWSSARDELEAERRSDACPSGGMDAPGAPDAVQHAGGALPDRLGVCRGDGRKRLDRKLDPMLIMGNRRVNRCADGLRCRRVGAGKR